MNVSTVKGTIQGHTKKAWTNKEGGQMVDNSLVVDTGEKKITVHKHTRDSTEFNLSSGTQVQVSFDAITRQGKNGEYTVNNIIKDGLTVLSSGSTAKSESKESVAPLSLISGSSNKGSYDPNGARNGMIAGKAVELAISRKGSNLAGLPTLDDLKQAAQDVLALTFYVEAGAKQETKVKEPVKAVKKVEKKIEAVKTPESLEEEDFSFDD